MYYDFLFAVVAPREVEFFVNIADNLNKKYGFKSAFLTFYEPADRYIFEKRYKIFSLHKEISKFLIEPDEQKIIDFQKRNNVDNIRNLILHEKLTFNRFDENRLISKLLSYENYFLNILNNNSFGCIIQELGAFIAPITLYCVAKFKRANHIFVEPSVFRGYVFLNLNSTEVDLNLKTNQLTSSKKIIEQYNLEYHNKKVVAIPVKDKHHFIDAGFKKLINIRNLKRLSQKIYYKYIRSEKEEYDAISNHVKKNVVAVLRRKFLSNFYSEFDFNRKYVYFPLHVPLDFQLTYREPRYLNQLSIVEYISNVLPYNIYIYIKEHPASIGQYDFWQMKKLLKNNNVKLISPNVNSYDIIKNSMFVITINSKVGAEALFQGKKVYVLGNPYYIKNKYAYKLNSLDDVSKIDFNYSNYNYLYYDEDFFVDLASSSLKGELYLNTEQNIDEFSDSILKVLNY